MITTETDHILLRKMKNKDMKSIIDWFNEQKRSLYTFGWIFLKNSQGVEEAFHHTIVKVHDEIHHVKEDNYKAWIISIFRNQCRDMSKRKQEHSLQGSESFRESETNPGVFRALDQLDDNEKETIVLTYVIGLSRQEVSYILDVPVEKVISRLTTGLKIMATGNIMSCGDYQSNFINYLDRTLSREKKIDLEIHIHTCQSCQNELSSSQECIFTLTNSIYTLVIPEKIMQNVQQRIDETVNKRMESKKKRTRVGVIIACFSTLILCTAFITNGFSAIYYSWVDWREQEDEQLRAYLKSGLGERLNMEAESNGVKVKIKSVIADDVQTLIYYEIEDLNEENQYTINIYDGLEIKSENQNRLTAMPWSPDSASNEIALNSEQKNIYKGKFSSLPIKSDHGTIELKISKVQKVSNLEGGLPLHYDSFEYVEGNWVFEIPITKHPSIVHEMDTKTQIDGILLHFEKLTLAPTATILEYSFENTQPGQRISAINIKSIETKKKTVEADLGGMYYNSFQDTGWNSLQTTFGTLYSEDPKDITVQFGSVNLFIENYETVDIDVSKEFPQNFEYLGNKISIDEIVVGSPTTIVMTEELPENRAYETLHLQFAGENIEESLSMGTSSEGWVIDRNGEKYNIHDLQPNTIEKLVDPRYFETKNYIDLYNDFSNEEVIPKKLEIYGYNSTKYIEDVVDISLD